MVPGVFEGENVDRPARRLLGPNMGWCEILDLCLMAPMEPVAWPGPDWGLQSGILSSGLF